MKALLVLAALVAPQVETYTQTLNGYVGFCDTYAHECMVDTSEPSHIQWTPEIQAALEEVSQRVNREIEPVEDKDQWGVVDRWDFAETGKGDCEDIQLVKRQELVKLGIPHRALRMAVALDWKGDGHAVLLVMTDAGEMVLDNTMDEVVLAQDSPHRFLKRESSHANFTWTTYRVEQRGNVFATAAQ